MRRLVDRGYLLPVERRLVGGSRGGSGQVAYTLGRRGWFLMHEGEPYRVWRTINYHALAIADTYLELLRLERQGKLSIVGYSNEPDCHATVAGNELRPDMFVEVERGGGRRVKVWVEQDMASQGRKIILAKVARYYAAFESGQLEEFPSIAFVTVDDARASELRWMLESAKPEARRLFRVMTKQSWVAAFS